MVQTRIARTRPRTFVARGMVGISAKINYARALRPSSNVPFIMLTEFPRSGGNWVRDMFADALQLPAPRFPRFPITFAAIAHNHDHRVLTGCDAIYVIRDGRDAFMSHFDKNKNAYISGSFALRKRLLRLHPSLEALKGETPDRDAVDPVDFYNEWTRRSVGNKVNWGRHVKPWLEADLPRVARVRYEDFRTSPEETLAKGVAVLAEKPVPEETIRFAVLRNSFKAQTGREPGQMDATSTKRQGLVGAWKTQMPEEVQKRFARNFGPVLEQAGYEV